MKQTLSRLATIGAAALLILFSGGCDRFEEEQGAGDDHGGEHSEGPADERGADKDDQGGHGDHDDHGAGNAPTSLDELPEDVNAVQHEMRLLDEAMRTTLTLIANDQLEGIPDQIQTVHPAREITMEALEKGEYELPKNADRMEEFEALDEAFHDDLKALLEASREDDLEGATDAYGDIVQGCTNCHTEYRF